MSWTRSASLLAALLALHLPHPAMAGPYAYNATAADTMFRLDARTCGFVAPAPDDYLLRPPNLSIGANGGPLEVTFWLAGAGHSWELRFRPPTGQSLEAGYLYFRDAAFDSSGVEPGLIVIRDGSGWYGTTSAFEVREAAFGPGGQVLSFWATFDQECAGGLTLDGEIRYNAHVGLNATTALHHLVDRNQTLAFAVSAVDPEGGAVTLSAPVLPPGATFSARGGGVGTFSWVPSFGQRGVHTAVFEATTGTSIPVRTATRIRVRGDTSGRFVIHPVFGGDGSTELDTPEDYKLDLRITGAPDAVVFRVLSDYLVVWEITMASPAGTALTVGTYGNASAFPVQDPTQAGLSVIHSHTVYPFSEGRFEVKQIERSATNGLLSFWATFETRYATYPGMSGEIRYDADVVPARALIVGKNQELRLIGERPTWCLNLEPQNGSFAVVAADLGAVTLGRRDPGGVVHTLKSAGVSVAGDQDGNGQAELAACFPLEDLRTFFSDIHGAAVIPLEIVADVTSGGQVHETTALRVIGSPAAVSLAVAPNPLNPETAISFYTAAGGRIRIRVFDLAGRLVRTVLDETRPGGYQTVHWNGETQQSRKAASGVYRVLLETPLGREIRSIVVVR